MPRCNPASRAASRVSAPADCTSFIIPSVSMKKPDTAAVRSRNARVWRSTRGRSARITAICTGTATSAISSKAGLSSAIRTTSPHSAIRPFAAASSVSIAKR